MLKIKNLKNELLLKVGVGIICIHLMFFIVSIYIMTFNNNIRSDELILTNPMLAIDLLALCGKIWIASYLVELKKSDEKKLNNIATTNLFILSVFMLIIRDYFLCFLLLLLFYKNVEKNDKNKYFTFENFFKSKMFFLTFLYVFLFVVSLRIYFS